MAHMQQTAHMQMSRRSLIGSFLPGMFSSVAMAQTNPPRMAKEETTMVKHIDAGVLNVGYVETGPASGWPVVLLHGFPYDIHAYDEVSLLLAAEGARIIVP